MAASMAQHASIIGRQKVQRLMRPLISSGMLRATYVSRNVCEIRRINSTYDIFLFAASERNIHTAPSLSKDEGREGGSATGLREGTSTRRSKNNHDLKWKGVKREDSDGPNATSRYSKVEEMKRRLRDLHNLSTKDRVWEGKYYLSEEDEERPPILHSVNGSHGHDGESLYTPENDDFFGIRDDMAEEVSARIKDKTSQGRHPHRDDLTQKFKKILSINAKNNKDREKVIDLPYGIMRRDQDNRPRKHGRIDADQTQVASLQDESNYLTARLFDTNQASLESSNKDSSGRKSRQPVDTENQQSREVKAKTETAELNYFDEEFFGSVTSFQNERSGPLNNKGDYDHSIGNDIESIDKPSKLENIGINRKQTTSTLRNSLSNYFDEQYFEGDAGRNESDNIPLVHRKVDGEALLNTWDTTSNEQKINKNLASSQQHDSVPSNGNEPNLFDDQYFPEAMGNKVDSQHKSDPVQAKHESKNSDASRPRTRNLATSILDTPSAFNVGNDTEYSCSESLTSNSHEHLSKVQVQRITDPQPPHKKALNSLKVEKERDISGTFGDLSVDSEENIYVGGTTRQQKRLKKIVRAKVENPETAYDYVTSLRRRMRSEGSKDSSSPNDSQWDGEVDSKGFRKLKNQVRDINNIPEDVVVKILHDSVLYETDEFIAIDKPYGLPSHGGPGIHHSVGKLAPRLADRIGIDSLELVHRLDKETTGVMLLAKTNDALMDLRSYFKERRVIKRYWVITKGIPNPLEGVIDIPMVESEVGNRYRMKLLPYKTDETSILIKKQHSDLPRKDAVTNYRVLDSNNKSALVECHPESGVKHQIRCHLAFGLNTPILGDHKYSHFSKMAPQKLPSEMLQRLNIRQPTVRYVPMHLHAKELVLPQFYQGRNVFISSRLPKHFVQNMKWLKLKPPKGR